MNPPIATQAATAEESIRAPQNDAPPLQPVACPHCQQIYLAPTGQADAVIECPHCLVQAPRHTLHPPPARQPARTRRRTLTVAGWLTATLLAAAILSAAAWGLRQFHPASTPSQSARSNSAPPNPTPAEAQALDEARTAAARILASTDWTTVRSQFLGAEQLAPLMQRYHSRHPWKPIQLTQDLERHLTHSPDGRRSATLVTRTSQGPASLTLHLEETLNGWKLDWENLVQARQFAWEIFHEDQPSSPVTLHLLARRGSATEAHFDSSGLTRESALAVRLDGPEPGLPTLALVPKASDLGRLFQRELTWEQPRPYLCELRLTNASLSPPLVEITAFLSEGWPAHPSPSPQPTTPSDPRPDF